MKLQLFHHLYNNTQIVTNKRHEISTMNSLTRAATCNAIEEKLGKYCEKKTMKIQ